MIKLLLNTLTLLITLGINYYAASGKLGSEAVGDISKKYETLFAPADYAFAIWGFIYLLLMLFVGYQWYAYFVKKEKHLIKQIGLWFIIANFCNSLWLLAWLLENFAISVILMLFLLYSLIRIVRRLNMENWDAPLRVIAFVWWPITFYLGWIIVALVANISVFLTAFGWDGVGLSEETWTIIMIAIATAVYLLLIKTRNMREASLVGIWAFIAIAVKQWEVNTSIVWTAIIASVVLFVASGWHGYKNRETSPFRKLKGET
ncbi:MAG: hypothetical protein ACNS60_04920 [Candidatus Cyclobacteriaceae bacterium M2_1C_046]